MEVCKLTMRHTPGMGPSPPPAYRAQQSVPPMEATPLNHSSVNGSIRRAGGQEKYRPKPLPSRAIQNQAQIFRKRMCDDIRPPTPSQIKALEVRWRGRGREREMDKWIGGWTNWRIVGWPGGWEWIGRWMNGRMYGWMDE